MDTLFIRKLNFLFTNVRHVILSRVMTFDIKFFGKIKIYDGLYNCLLCVITVYFFQSSSHIQKNFFHDQN
jgi:hypothetical protein